VLSVVFGTFAMVGGVLVALGGSLPISPYVTTISFTIYVVCRIIGARRVRRGWGPRAVVSASRDPETTTV
jgi:zinc/manganese transport system permease protein